MLTTPAQIYRSVYNGYQDMLDYNLDSDDEMETVSVMVVDEAGNLVPVTTESGVRSSSAAPQRVRILSSEEGH